MTERRFISDRRRDILRAIGATGIASISSIGTAIATSDKDEQTGDQPTVGGDHRENRLRGIARRHYRFFEEFTSDIGLPDDIVDVGGDSMSRSYRTSPSNIAMYLISTVGAAALGFVPDTKARRRINTVVSTLESLEKWNGLFLRWYDIRTGQPWMETHDGTKFVSTVDNGHLTAALVVVGEAYDDDLAERARALVASQDYSSFYHPDNGQLRGGYDYESGVTDWTYGMVNSEPRVASYCAIGMGDIPDTHWWQPNRTFGPDADWTQQAAEGENRTYDGVTVFEGHYEYNGTAYVPSWGGAQFEALMPSLFIKEQELGTDGFGKNNAHWSRVQIDFAREQGWPVWGLSPCGTPDGYGTYGVPEQGAWDGHYAPGPIVTPHATFLALDYAPEAAIENVKQLRKMGIDGAYGFYDSVNAETGELTEKFYALDQGMSIAAIANHLTDGVIREYFHESDIGERPEHLLERETFSI
ncbi:glucoamylase family protein [Halocatena marina]|uniref:glucoamylase family protein n=1 Tax=Halocatena marina TaxID=2934937 RepID=UPI00200BD5C5|nr:glucoamylase family protein [Halocatena marina]